MARRMDAGDVARYEAGADDAGAEFHLQDGSASEKSDLLQNGAAAVKKARFDDGDGEQLAAGGREEEMDGQGPTDRWHLMFFFMLLHGLGVLIPWNAFITITAYFIGYKLAGDENEVYRKNFLSYLGISSQVPNLLLGFINLFVQIKGNLRPRIVGCLTINIALCALTIALAVADSTQWPGAFFWLTMFTVVVLNASNGVYQNSLFGLAADFPPTFIATVVLGNNLCGLFISLINIIALLGSTGERMAAICYFSVALFVLVVCIVSYMYLHKNRFYHFHHQKGMLKRELSVQRELAVLNEKLAGSGASGGDGAVAGCWSKFRWTLRPYIELTKEIWIHVWNVWFAFFVTLTAFPAMTAAVQSTDPAFPFHGDMFLPVTCFLLFNLFAVVGAAVANHVQFPSPDYVWLPILLRGLFIPFYFVCNYRPEYRTFAVLVGSDYVYALGTVLLGLTQGYFSALAMMYAKGAVSDDKKKLAGMISGFFLVFGIACGVNFSLAVAHVCDEWGPLPAKHLYAPAALPDATVANGTGLAF